jgi:carboxymethylenebutenolidase
MPDVTTERTETIRLADGTAMRALLTLPDGERPANGWPLVLAIHDAFGFSDDIRRIARRFADNGYAALAPAIYDGAGAPVLCVVRTLRDLQARRGAAFDRLEAARAHAAALPEVDGDRLGITGFCMGGGFAIFFAARGGLKVCAPYYGDTPDRAEELRSVCPVVAGFGALDRQFAVQGERLEQHLTELGVPHDVKIYPGVGHSYMNDLGDGMLASLMRRTPMHAGYDEDASEDSWRRMLSFFAEHL